MKTFLNTSENKKCSKHLKASGNKGKDGCLAPSRNQFRLPRGGDNQILSVGIYLMHKVDMFYVTSETFKNKC